MTPDPMTADTTQFHYRDGRLHAEDVALDVLAEAVGTPFYCYSSGALGSVLQCLRARGLRPAGVDLLRAQG